MPLQLLDLPAEILLSCLSYLSLTDIFACLQLHNAALCRLILQAPAIQFRVAQAACAVTETAYGEAGPLFKRRKALKEREERWRTFTPSHRRVVKTRPDPPALYDVGEDCYALAYITDLQTMLGDNVGYMFLNVNDEEPVWLQPADITEPVLDMCVASEWDLMVVVTLSVENAGMRMVAAHLRQLSTGAVQEGLVKTIDVAKVPASHGVPDVRVDVAGSTLAIACCFLLSETGDSDQDLLHLIHWPSGRTLIDAVPCPLSSFMFVHDAFLLVPNPHAHCLDALALTARLGGNRDADWMLPLRLPALRVGQRILWNTFDCRGQPHPQTLCTTPAQTRTPFRPEPEQTPIFLMFDTTTAPSDAADPDTDDDTENSQTVVVIDRARLQECLYEAYLEFQSDAAGAREVPFATWGMRASTWLDVGPGGLALSEYAVTGCVGTRFAALSAEADPAGPKHVRILDFNETAVARVAKQLRAARSDVLQGTNATSRVHLPATGAAREDSVFAEPLGAALGYVDITSREVVDWEVVHLSNACILGEKNSDVDGERELHVLHFG